MKVKYHRDILLIHHLFIYLCASYTSALYFHISATERKCFIETVGKKPNETVVIGNYKCELYDANTGGFMLSGPGNGMHVEIRDPDDEIILSKVYGSEGKFSFASNTPGAHVICLYSNTTKWSSGSQLRVHLDFQVGDNNENAIQEEMLRRFQSRFVKFLDRVEQILEEHNSQRYQEEYFRQTSESIDQRILLWFIFQICILILIGLWLRFSLRTDYHQGYTALQSDTPVYYIKCNPSLLHKMQQEVPQTGILNNDQ